MTEELMRLSYTGGQVHDILQQRIYGLSKAKTALPGLKRILL